MRSVEQRARDWIVESAGPLKLDRITPEEAWRIAYEAGFAAALREQPEARGVVDAEWIDSLQDKWALSEDRRSFGEVVCEALTAAQQPEPPSAPVGVEDSPIDANDNADYIEHCADRLERCGLRITAGALRVIAHEHRALTQQSAEAAPGCTCPSGDGSLRWPCPTHPPGDDAAGGGHD